MGGAAGKGDEMKIYKISTLPILGLNKTVPWRANGKIPRKEVKSWSNRLLRENYDRVLASEGGGALQKAQGRASSGKTQAFKIKWLTLRMTVATTR